MASAQEMESMIASLMQRAQHAERVVAWFHHALDEEMDLMKRETGGSASPTPVSVRELTEDEQKDPGLRQLRAHIHHCRTIWRQRNRAEFDRTYAVELGSLRKELAAVRTNAARHAERAEEAEEAHVNLEAHMTKTVSSLTDELQMLRVEAKRKAKTLAELTESVKQQQVQVKVHQELVPALRRKLRAIKHAHAAELGRVTAQSRAAMKPLHAEERARAQVEAECEQLKEDLRLMRERAVSYRRNASLVSAHDSERRAVKAEDALRRARTKLTKTEAALRRTRLARKADQEKMAALQAKYDVLERKRRARLRAKAEAEAFVRPTDEEAKEAASTNRHYAAYFKKRLEQKQAEAAALSEKLVTVARVQRDLKQDKKHLQKRINYLDIEGSKQGRGNFHARTLDGHSRPRHAHPRRKPQTDASRCAAHHRGAGLG